MPSSHVVFLIHGTWGRGFLPWTRKEVADWCTTDSPCRRAVEAALGMDTVFVPKKWSGSNSPTERIKASKQLRADIIKYRREVPAAKIHLLSHSHGGNVAFYAARGIETDLASITCLSTPFILFLPRETDRTRSVISGWSAAIGLAVFVIVLFLLHKFGLITLLNALLDRAPTWIGGGPTRLLIAVLYWLSTMALTYLGCRSWLGQRAEKQSCLVEDMNLDLKPPIPTCLIRSPEDEAGEGIAVVRIVSGTVTFLADISKKASQFPYNFLVTLVLTLATAACFFFDANRALTGALLGVTASIFMFSKGKPDLWTDIVFVFLFTAASVLTLAYNGGLLLMNLRYRVAVESTPLGEWQLTVVQHVGPGLNHSTPSNPNALAKMTSWLQGFGQ